MHDRIKSQWHRTQLAFFSPYTSNLLTPMPSWWCRLEYGQNGEAKTNRTSLKQIAWRIEMKALDLTLRIELVLFDQKHKASTIPCQISNAPIWSQQAQLLPDYPFNELSRGFVHKSSLVESATRTFSLCKQQQRNSRLCEWYFRKAASRRLDVCATPKN